jgi:dienelactone hydrolase
MNACTPLVALLFSLLATIPRPARAETFDVEMPSGDSHDKAAFRLWLPDDVERVRANLVLVPGSNGDGRGQVDDPFWRELATKHGLALVGVYLTDKLHEDMFIEHYVDVRRGSGRAFLEAMVQLGESSGHPEVGTAPLLLWGMSAGGEFNYEMAQWMPRRVLGFIVNKGNIYYTAQAGRAGREVPGLFFIGETDLEFRNDIIRGIYSANRRARALWALVVEPGVGHEVARSREMAAMFFEELLALRLTDNGMRALELSEGFLCDPKTNTCGPAADAEAKRYPTAWLPSQELADAWRAVTTGAPF